MTTPTLEEREKALECLIGFNVSIRQKAGQNAVDRIVDRILAALKAEYERGQRDALKEVVKMGAEYSIKVEQQFRNQRHLDHAKGAAAVVNRVIAALPITHDSEKEGGG